MSPMKLPPLPWALLLLTLHSLLLPARTQAQTCPQTVTNTPVDCTNFAVGRGKLALKGIQLVDQFEEVVQLRGLSSHGLQHAPNCVTKDSIAYLVTHWGINVYRAVVYVDEWENGYTVNAEFFDEFIVNVVQWCKELGIYVIIDWHVIGDPNAHMDAWYQPTSGLALDFFAKYSLLYKDETHVLYEIANEPTNVAWPSLVWYHNIIIEGIRANSPDAIIIAGTCDFSTELNTAFDDPVDNPHNVLYAFHFYAASHADLIPFFAEHAAKMPIFVSEWGISESDGSGEYDVTTAEEYLNICSGVNDLTPPKVVISWLQWSFSDIDETASLLEPNSCSSSQWEDTSCPGKFTENYMKTRAYGDVVLDCDRAPTHAPTISSFPTSMPSGQPSNNPTSTPTSVPTIIPSGEPSSAPSISQVPTAPSSQPTIVPSGEPSCQPTSEPTTTNEPTVAAVVSGSGSSGSNGIPPEGIFFIVAGGVGLLITAFYFYEHRKTKNENDHITRNFMQVSKQPTTGGGAGVQGRDCGLDGGLELESAPLQITDATTGSAGAGGGGGEMAAAAMGAGAGAVLVAGSKSGSGSASNTNSIPNDQDNMELGNIYNNPDDEGTFSTSRRDSLRDLAQSMASMEEYEQPSLSYSKLSSGPSPPQTYSLGPPQRTYAAIPSAQPTASPSPSRSPPLSPQRSHSPTPPRPPSPTSSVTSSSSSSTLNRQPSRQHSSRSPSRRQTSFRNRPQSPTPSGSGATYQRSTLEPTRNTRSQNNFK